MKIEVYPEARRIVMEFDNGQTVTLADAETVENFFEAVTDAEEEWEEGLFALDMLEDGFHE